MPTIKPLDSNDCLEFIKNHEKEIIEGVYDIDIESEWVKHINSTKLSFLAHYCPSSRHNIAKNTTVGNILESLANIDLNIIRKNVAENKNSPASALEKLAKDPDRDIRAAVASHQKTPAPVLEVLYRDADPRVREASLRNKNIPKYILKILAQKQANPKV